MTTLARAPRQVKPRRFEVSLTLEINGTDYNTTPILGIQDETIERAWRLEKRGDADAVYDVARGTDGIVTCTCPDYETRHRGLSLTGCKHCRAVVSAGLLEGSNILEPIAEERALIQAPPLIPEPSAESGVDMMSTPAVEPTIDESFLAELDPSWELVPQVDGTGLSPEEYAKVVHRGSTVKAAYLASVPAASAEEVERVERNGRLDALRAVLRKRPEAPCCSPEEAAPCSACGGDLISSDVVRDVYLTAPLPAGADEHMTEEELADLAELNATNPAGAVEAELERFPAFAGWPDYVSNFYWSDTPTVELAQEPRLTLVEIIEHEAAKMRAKGLEAYDLMAGALTELARVVRVVSADRPDQVEERLSVLDRDFTEHAAAWEMPEPEMTSAGRWA